MASRDQVTVVGAGMMGPGIATSAALGGHSAVIVMQRHGVSDRTSMPWVVDLIHVFVQWHITFQGFLL